MKRFVFLIMALGVAASALALFAPAAEKNPTVVMETSLGTIKIELYPDKAPITVKNFLGYVDDKFYDGTVFHRVIANFMIQGGGFEPGLKEKATKEEIKNESSNGLSNTRGTIAMARKPQPDTASAQFFINVKDNLGLDGSEDKAGYAVFGKVIEGMDVVDKIKAVETHEAEGKINGRSVPFQDVPVKDVVIKSIRRVEK
jgi:cyclophilin family peptidyl-prolyl cis-trans isomerase